MLQTTELATFLGVDEATEWDGLQRAIDGVRVVDANGLTPSDVGYTPTSDLHLAAAAYVDGLAVRHALGQLTGDQIASFTSEGSTFTLRTLDGSAFAHLSAHLRSLSPLWRGRAGLGLIDVERADTFVPRSAGVWPW